MCMFKALHRDTTHAGEHKTITRDEFYSFYEVQGMRWKQVGAWTIGRCASSRSRETFMILSQGVDQHLPIYIDLLDALGRQVQITT